MPETKNIILNLTKINQAHPHIPDMQILNDFLKSTPQVSLWLQNRLYEYQWNNIKCTFCFTQSLLRRKRKMGREGDRFEIFDPQKEAIGSGCYGIIYPVLGTISLENGRPVLKTKKQRVIKIEGHGVKKAKNVNEQDELSLKRGQVIKEHNNLVQAGHLSVKPPVFTCNGSWNNSYLVMKSVHGFRLDHIPGAADIINKIPPLTVLLRLEMTFAVLNAVKNQITDRGLIHRDLKSANILMDLSQSPPVATIVDYGSAIKEGEQDYRVAGTCLYRSPEGFMPKPQYTSKSDCYSAGRILSRLWGDNCDNYWGLSDTSWEKVKEKSTNEELFSAPDVKLFSFDQDKIRDCLSGLMKENAEERWTLDKAIKHFSEIGIEKYRMNKFRMLSKAGLIEYEDTLKTRIASIQNFLLQLIQTGEALDDQGYIQSAEIIMGLGKLLGQETDNLAKNPDPAALDVYRNCCLAQINYAKQQLQEHQNMWWLLAELVTAVGLLGAGYILALGINYKITGRAGLFSPVNSEQIVDEIAACVVDLSDNVIM